MRLQRRFLERAGHTVTIVAPKMHGRARGGRSGHGVRRHPLDPDHPRPRVLAVVAGPPHRSVRGRRSHRAPSGRCRARAGRLLGRLHRASVRRAPRPAGRAHDAQPRRRRHRGDRTVPAARAARAERVAAARAASAGAAPAGRDGWSYLRRFAGLSSAVTAPSSHFARRLHEHGVVAADGSPVIDVWNGIDDDVLDAALAAGPAVRAPGRPRFVWLGRMSPEKRLLPFLEALARVAASTPTSRSSAAAGRRRPRVGSSQKLGLDRHRRLRGSAAVRRDPAAHRGRRRRRADLDRLRDAGHDRVRGGLARHARDRQRPRHRRRAGLGVLAGRGWVGLGARRHSAPGGIRHRQPERRAVPDPSIRERFRQSSRTAAMVEVYDRARR